MVFLAVSATGLRQAIKLAETQSVSIWCGSDAIGDADYHALSGLDVSRFSYPLLGEPKDVLQDALDTIAEHHPNATIWVEQATTAA